MPLKTCCHSANERGPVVSLGEILIDLIPARGTMRLEDPGEVVKTASGSAGIFACAAARFGASSVFLGKLGRDPLSRMASRAIEAYGVDLSRAVESAEGQIGLAFIEYLEDRRNYQYYRTGSVGSFYSAGELDEDCVAGAYALHFPGMLLELSDSIRSACLKAAQVAKASGVLFSFDPNIRKEMNGGESRRRMLDMISLADVVEPTLDEARIITGKTGIGEILRCLHDMGPKVVALTRDKDGAVISAGGKVAFADGIDVDAVDPTGAGDTFSAALIACIQQGMNVEEAARFCNSAGTLVAMRRGAIGLSLPTSQEVRDMAASPLCVSRVESLDQLKD